LKLLKPGSCRGIRKNILRRIKDIEGLRAAKRGER